MKVGTKKQQGRTGEGRTGEKTREICPACQDEYLKNSYEFKGRKLVIIGKHCPNKLCHFSRKEMKQED